MSFFLSWNMVWPFDFTTSRLEVEERHFKNHCVKHIVRHFEFWNPGHPKLNPLLPWFNVSLSIFSDIESWFSTSMLSVPIWTHSESKHTRHYLKVFQSLSENKNRIKVKNFLFFSFLLNRPKMYIKLGVKANNTHVCS